MYKSPLIMKPTLTNINKIFFTQEQINLFNRAVKLTMKTMTGFLDEEIHRKSFGKWKTLDDVYPDKRKYISLQRFGAMSKTERRTKVFYSKIEKEVKYTCSITKEKKVESSNMYIMVSATAEKSKYLAPWFYPVLEHHCKQLGLDFVIEESDGYDAIINGVQVELKIGQGENTSQIATGNNHSKVKVDDIISIQFQMNGNEFTSLWVGHIDMSKATNPETKWSDTVTTSGKNNVGFSGLTVAAVDMDIITCYYGEVRNHAKNSPKTPIKTTHIVYDAV